MVLIKNGEVHIGNGEIIQNCDVLLKDDKIVDVGKNISNSKCETLIDATGKVIMPGFIDTMNSWGAKGPAWDDNDLNEHTNPITPELNSVFAFDHDAMNFQAVYEYGVTSFGLSPSIYNIIGGKISAFKTYGSNPYKMLIKEDIGTVASVSSSAKKVYGKERKTPMTKMGVYATLKQAFYEATNLTAKDEYNLRKLDLRRIIDKKTKLFVNCSSKSEIDSINMLLDEFDIDIVLTGAYGITNDRNYQFRNIVLGNLTDSMITYNYEMDIESINEMISDNITFSISSCGDSSAGGKETLLWNAILYYQQGINAEEILKMITLNPAKILGIENRVGSIEIGKDADIIIWSNNPILTFDAKIVNAYINGYDVSKLKRRKSCW